MTSGSSQSRALQKWKANRMSAVESTLAVVTGLDIIMCESLILTAVKPLLTS